MDNHHLNGENCDNIPTPTPKPKLNQKKIEIINGYTIKYHANGRTRWSKGKMLGDKTDGYWEWYRPDGTLKRSGYFNLGTPTGEWTTYDQDGKPYKVTNRG